nr:hypothetical protein [Neobacillus sp. Marseille-Q6967]
MSEKDLGAIKIWEEFKSYAPEIREELIYGYILAFCETVVSNDGRIIRKPKEQIIENRTLEEKTDQSVGNIVLIHLLGIPGIGLLAKFEDWEEKRRQEKVYYKIKNDIWENPLEEIMKLEKFQQLKKEMMKRVNGFFLKEKYTRY